MDVPSPIANFFQMKNIQDELGLADLFTHDAIVIDGGEGKTMQGSEAIRGWIEKSISGLDLHSEIQDIQKEDASWIVDTRMTGSFAASPAHFQYAIRLHGDKISWLQVNFLGSLK